MVHSWDTTWRTTQHVSEDIRQRASTCSLLTRGNEGLPASCEDGDEFYTTSSANANGDVWNGLVCDSGNDVISFFTSCGLGSTEIEGETFNPLGFATTTWYVHSSLINNTFVC